MELGFAHFDAFLTVEEMLHFVGDRSMFLLACLPFLSFLGEVIDHFFYGPFGLIQHLLQGDQNLSFLLIQGHIHSHSLVLLDEVLGFLQIFLFS